MRNIARQDVRMENATKIRLGAASTSACVGAIVLFGWADNLTFLTQIVPGLNAMNPVSATAFILVGIGLALHDREPAWLTWAANGLVTAIGAGKVSELALGTPRGIDQLLFTAKLNQTVGLPPNHMAPNTAVALLFLGIAMAASHSRAKVAVFLSQALSLFVMAIALFALIGYTLNISALYEVRSFNAMALHSAAVLMISAIGVLSCNSNAGLLQVMGDRGPSGQLSRIVLPLTVLIPVGVEMLRQEGVTLGFYPPGKGIALQMFANIFVNFVLLMSSIFVLFRSDAERRRREVATARSEARYRVAEQMGRVGHWRQDLCSPAMECSVEFAKICGLPAGARPTQERVMALYEPEDAVRRRQFIERAVDTGAGWDSDASIVRPDGERRHIRSYGGTETDEQGGVVALFGVIVDVTELELSRQRAEAAMNAKASFLANMSHEIRTPLHSIIGFTDLMLDDDALAPELRRQLDLVKNSGDALLTVVNDILDFSKMEAGKVELAPRPFDLRHLIQSTIAIISQPAEAKGLSLTFDIDEEVSRAFIGDDSRLRQILLNLLGNAVKFTAAGGVALNVANVSADGCHTVVFDVVDTGTGIPPEQECYLFKQFSQTDSSMSREHGGTGLGLAICKSLVSLMGGTIGYATAAHGGSRFWFKIPLERTSHVVEERTDIHSSPSPSQKRILVVEDLAVNQELADAMLTRAGHCVEIANNGREAIAAVQRRAFDLVLMDIQMPVMDGLTATKLIRLLPGSVGTVPIIALSANVLPEQIKVFSDAGMSGHLAKPVKLSDLNHAIMQHSRHPAQTVSGALLASDRDTPLLDETIYREIAALLKPERMRVHLGSFKSALIEVSRPGRSPGETRDSAHRIAGQAGMFGFLALAQLCRDLETALSNGEPAAELMRKLENAVALAQPNIDRLEMHLAA